MHWNKHSCSLDLAGDRRAAFSIVPVGNQIADSGRLIAGTGCAGSRAQISRF
jgi:hypothetical protein